MDVAEALNEVLHRRDEEAMEEVEGGQDGDRLAEEEEPVEDADPEESFKGPSRKKNRKRSKK